jgi:hypothetical protein
VTLLRGVLTDCRARTRVAANETEFLWGKHTSGHVNAYLGLGSGTCRPPRIDEHRGLAHYRGHGGALCGPAGYSMLAVVTVAPRR